jgi:hypothetical protein
MLAALLALGASAAYFGWHIAFELIAPEINAGMEASSTQWTIVVTPTQASTVSDAQKVIERSGGTAAVQKAFSSSNNYKAFTNKLNALVQTIKAGNFADAQDKIQNDLLKRVVQWVTMDPGVKAKLEAQLQYINNELGQLQSKQ